MDKTADDLLARLQAATGPSRELDAEIALANGWIERRRQDLQGFYTRWHGTKGQDYPDPPRFSESIDAALTLVPEGWNWNLTSFNVAVICRNYHDDTAKVYWSQKPSQRHVGWDKAEGTVATPAIALLIAIERAKEDSKRET